MGGHPSFVLCHGRARGRALPWVAWTLVAGPGHPLAGVSGVTVHGRRRLPESDWIARRPGRGGTPRTKCLAKRHRTENERDACGG